MAAWIGATSTRFDKKTDVAYTVSAFPHHILHDRSTLC